MSNLLTIYDELGNRLCEVLPDDGSYRYREIKGDDEVTLTFPSSVPLHLPPGSYLLYDGIRYTLEEPPCIKKQGRRQLEYTCIFSAPVSMLKRYIFRNTDDGRLKFSLTAKPDEHLAMLVKNMNLRVGGWRAGAFVDDAEKLVTYDCTTCWDALEQMADAFGTEWEVNDKEISLKKVAYFEDNPLSLSYGLGRGLLPGVSRDNRDGESCGLEIVYAIGGERNIVPSKNTGGQKKQWHRPITSIAPIAVAPNKELAASSPAVQSASSITVNPGMEGTVNTESGTEKITTTNPEGVAVGNKCLILPRGQELEYEGEVYCTDAQGYYVYKKNKPLTSRKEGALDCSDIYPSRVGTISEVIKVDTERHLYDIKDDTIPDDLDFSACQMEGEKITVIFQDGMLAGKEFDVDKYIHSERRFELVPQEIDGVMMPDDVFRPVIGGKYAVFGISLPEAYVCDNASKTGASWDMFRKAAAYLHEHSDYLFTFGGKLDGIWAKRNWEAIKDRIVLGGTVLFQDNQLQADGVRIRITGIRQSLNDPHSPELTLSNETIGQRLLGRIEQAESQDVLIDAASQSGRQFTKRTFRDAKETMNKLQEALESFQGEFTEGISPITVNTMQMLVGSEQCQFEFVSGNGSDTVVEHDAGYDKDSGTFHCAAGYVRYQSGSVMAVEPSWLYAHAPEFTSGALTADNADNAYYVYMHVPKQGDGAFLMSDTPKNLTDGDDRYLLLGILDSEQFGNRSWCPMYGYTEITPGRIRVNKIISPNGNAYFDLINEEIGGRINFKDGLVSGEVGVAGSTGAINAGMSGADDEDVRFWAGADSAGKADAPFRVHDNGNVVMNDALIGGNSMFGGILKQNVITIDGMSVTGDTNGKQIFYSPIGGKVPVIDWSRIFGFRTTVIVNSLPDFDFESDMFGLRSDGIILPKYFHGNLQDYIGNRIRIINRSDKPIELGACVLLELGEYGDTTSSGIAPGNEVDMEFVINVLKHDGNGNHINKKIMAWYIHYNGPIVNTEN